MGFNSRVSNAIVKLQNLPEKQRKIIFYVIISICVLVMIFLLVLSIGNNIAKVTESGKSIDLPEFNTDDLTMGANSIDANALQNISGEDSNNINWK